MALVTARCPRTGHAIELTEDSEHIVRYSFNGAKWPGEVTTRAALLRDLDCTEPASPTLLAFGLLLRFIDANDALVSEAEELRLP